MSDPVLLLDVGTTTISGAIVDRGSSRLIACDSVLNSQLRFGDDVVSRIGFAIRESANASLLQKAVVYSVNKLLVNLLAQASLKKKDIKEAFCVCNTAMHHLFLGINTASLVTPPYKTTQKSEITIYADRTDLKLRKDSPITFLPNIGGFVGSDALAVVISSGIYKSSSFKLAIDIGTNGEVILGNRENISVASTAAGPAFEGRHISCGMPAIEGAIESVKIKARGIDLKVIGGGRPKGICGSGLIDAVDQMLKAGLMDSSGKMDRGEFILYKRGNSKIHITQADIRKMQLAKAAIYAATKVLLRRPKVDAADIKEVLVTGSFGNRINPDSVLGIELIPTSGKGKIRFLKQGALEGLRLYVGSPSLQKGLTSILSKIKHIPLFGRGFQKEFTSSMFMG